MKTKTPRAEKREPETLPNPAPGVVAESQDDISRLSFAVDAGGNVMWDRMRGKTKEELKRIISSPETAKALGLDTPAAQPVEVFDPAWTGSLYDAIGKLEAWGASKLYKIPADIADQAFTYSEAEKAKLAGPTAKVINKYAAVWMVQFKDEIALAFLIVTITAVKLQMASALTQMRGAQERVSAPPRPIVVPTPQDIDPATLENSVKDKPADA